MGGGDQCHRELAVTYDPEFIYHLLQYMVSADRAGFDAARGLSEAEYHKDRGFSFGSIHNVLVHQMVAQKTWLRRFLGEAPQGRLENQTEHPTRELLAERWAMVHADLLAFAAAQTRESINRVARVRRNNGELLTAPLGALMMHVADHGSYHRGQLATMLKQSGVQPAYSPYFRYACEPGRQTT